MLRTDSFTKCKVSGNFASLHFYTLVIFYVADSSGKSDFPRGVLLLFLQPDIIFQPIFKACNKIYHVWLNCFFF
jgi:hypothetical protein